MFFICGISQGRKSFDFFRQTMICKKCGRLSGISVFMVYSYFSLFFLPLFRWGKTYYAQADCCGAVYALESSLGRAIEHGEAVSLREEDLHLVGADSRSRNCPDCGFLLSPEYAYCPKCGRKLSL